jgi:putative glycerol-1-phosphate prenyltransferase
MHIKQHILEAQSKNKKLFAVLIDPDKVDSDGLSALISRAVEAKVDLFFLGGSLLTKDVLDEVAKQIKSSCTIPVLLFPGNGMQVSKEADAILFLSLISGRNPDLLIGQQVQAAPLVKQSGIEVLATGYMLIDGGTATTVSYISNTMPIPANKPDIAACTAMAGEMLGLSLFYLDAGSGAKEAIPAALIQKVKASIQSPIIVGGGIRSVALALDACKAGADIIVVGNAIEKDPSLLTEIAAAIHQVNA